MLICCQAQILIAGTDAPSLLATPTKFSLADRGFAPERADSPLGLLGIAVTGVPPPQIMSSASDNLQRCHHPPHPQCLPDWPQLGRPRPPLQGGLEVRRPTLLAVQAPCCCPPPRLSMMTCHSFLTTLLHLPAVNLALPMCLLLRWHTAPSNRLSHPLCGWWSPAVVTLPSARSACSAAALPSPLSRIHTSTFLGCRLTGWRLATGPSALGRPRATPWTSPHMTTRPMAPVAPPDPATSWLLRRSSRRPQPASPQHRLYLRRDHDQQRSWAVGRRVGA